MKRKKKYHTLPRPHFTNVKFHRKLTVCTKVIAQQTTTNSFNIYQYMMVTKIKKKLKENSSSFPSLLFMYIL